MDYFYIIPRLALWFSADNSLSYRTMDGEVVAVDCFVDCFWQNRYQIRYKCEKIPVLLTDTVNSGTKTVNKLWGSLPSIIDTDCIG